MRPLLPGEVRAAACVLLAARPGQRPGLLARMLAEAETADAYRQETGRLHPLWGNGSLGAVARARERAREPALEDADYAACLALIFDSLAARAQPRRR